MKIGGEVVSTSPPMKISLVFFGPRNGWLKRPNPGNAGDFFRQQKKPLNSSPLKMGGWETILSFWGPAYFQRTVRFREGTCYTCLFLGGRSSKIARLGTTDEPGTGASLKAFW